MPGGLTFARQSRGVNCFRVALATPRCIFRRQWTRHVTADPEVGPKQAVYAAGLDQPDPNQPIIVDCPLFRYILASCNAGTVVHKFLCENDSAVVREARRD